MDVLPCGNCGGDCMAHEGFGAFVIRCGGCDRVTVYADENGADTIACLPVASVERVAGEAVQRFGAATMTVGGKQAHHRAVLLALAAADVPI